MQGIRVEMRVGFYVNCPLFWSDFNQNWNVSTHSTKTPCYKTA